RTRFDTAMRMTRDFTDGGGWRDPIYGTTMQLADIDGDGHADICGRGYAGLICAMAPGWEQGAAPRDPLGGGGGTVGNVPSGRIAAFFHTETFSAGGVQRPDALYARAISTPSTCDAGSQLQDGFCIPRCGSDHDYVPPYCLERCPPDYTDLGLSCLYTGG